jgi:hypothetical protein
MIADQTELYSGADLKNLCREVSFIYLITWCIYIAAANAYGVVNLLAVYVNIFVNI